MRGRVVRTVLLAAALGAVLGVPAAAQAAYAPKLAVTASPTNQPGGGITFSSTVTQSGDEEATKAARVRLPPGVSFDVATLNATTQCTPVQRDARACPDTSRIGSAVADTSVGQLTGGVFFGTKLEIYIFLHNDLLAALGQDPKPIVGRTEFPPDGSLVTVLDDLPTDITASRFQLSFNGPPKPILKSPLTSCGALPFSGTFTSKSGVKVTSTTMVTFTGCKGAAPAFSGVRLSRRTARIGTNVAISYSLNRAAKIDITVRRSGRAKILGHTTFSDGAGPSRVRLITSKLLPGNFIVTVKATADGKTASASRPLKLTAKPKRR
jgi:hypothetical protein